MTNTNPSFSEGIILIMRSWMESNVVLTTRYCSRFQIVGHEYILESLDVDEALEFFADTVDPEDRKKQEAESYTALFADPAGNYISSQLDAFQGNWELEMAAQA